MGVGGLGCLQSTGNGCGLQMDGFSAHFEPYGSMFDDFHDFDDFAVFSSRRTLFPAGPRTLRECPGGPGTLRECLVRLVAISVDKSQLVGT